MPDTVLVGIVIHLLRSILDGRIELCGESVIDPEDGFEVGLHVPEEVETVRLDLGEGLLVGDHASSGVFLGFEYSDDSGTDLADVSVHEGLLVDVE